MIEHPAFQTISEVEKDSIYLISVYTGNYCYYYCYCFFLNLFTLAILINLCFAGSFLMSLQDHSVRQILGESSSGRN